MSHTLRGENGNSPISVPLASNGSDKVRQSLSPGTLISMLSISV